MRSEPSSQAPVLTARSLIASYGPNPALKGVKPAGTARRDPRGHRAVRLGQVDVADVPGRSHLTGCGRGLLSRPPDQFAERGSDDPFYAQAFHLVDGVLAVAIAIAVAGLLVVAAEGVVTRRRTLAALVASGVPRRTLAAATLLEAIAPLVPTVLIATATGVLAARGVYGTTIRTSVPSATTTASGGSTGSASRDVVLGVPVPWVELATLAGGTLLLVIAITALSLLFLRRSTDLAELRAA